MSRPSDNASPGDISDPGTDTLTTAQIIDTLLELKDEAHSAEPDAQRLTQLTHTLFDRYRTTSYAAALEDPLEGPRLLADAADMHSGILLIGISSRELEELLFDTLGVAEAIDENNAVNVVGSARAFFDWLGREFNVRQAAELVDLLGDDAVRELEGMSGSQTRAVADALLLEAQAAGVDLADERALEAFLLRLIAKEDGHKPHASLDDDYELDAAPHPSAPTLTPEQQRIRQKKRKKNRKTARKARKKNR